MVFTYLFIENHASLLHAVNMIYYHWEIKKLLWAYERAEYSQAKRDIES